MPAWAEARRLASAIRSNAAKRDGGQTGDPLVDMLRDWFSSIYQHYAPDKQRCIFSSKNCGGRTTTGYVPSFGPVWKCENHKADYEEIVSALAMGE